MATKEQPKTNAAEDSSIGASEGYREEMPASREAVPETMHLQGEDEHHVTGSIGRLTTGVVDTVADTANTVIHGVGNVGGHAIDTATHLVTDVISGVRHILGAALGSGLGGRHKHEETRPPDEDANRRSR